MDAVIYQTLEGLRDSIREVAQTEEGRSATPCMACLDGKYPTDVSVGGKLAAKRKQDRGER